MHAEDAQTCNPEITAPKNTSCTESNVAADGASLTSSRKKNNYIRGSFQSTGFLTTVDIKPDPEVIREDQEHSENAQTKAALQEQLSNESGQSSRK